MVEPVSVIGVDKGGVIDRLAFPCLSIDSSTSAYLRALWELK